MTSRKHSWYLLLQIGILSVCTEVYAVKEEDCGADSRRYRSSCLWLTNGGDMISTEDECEKYNGSLLELDCVAELQPLLDGFGIKDNETIFLGAIRTQNGTSSYDWISKPGTGFSLDDHDITDSDNTSKECIVVKGARLMAEFCDQQVQRSICQRDVTLECPCQSALTTSEKVVNCGTKSEADGRQSFKTTVANTNVDISRSTWVINTNTISSLGGNITPLSSGRSHRTSVNKESIQPQNATSNSPKSPGETTTPRKTSKDPRLNKNLLNTFDNLFNHICGNLDISKMTINCPEGSTAFSRKATTKMPTTVDMAPLVKEVQFGNQKPSGKFQLSIFPRRKPPPLISPARTTQPTVTLAIVVDPVLLNTSKVLKDLTKHETVNTTILERFCETVDTALNHEDYHESSYATIQEQKEHLFNDIMKTGEQLVARLPSNGSVNIRTSTLVLTSFVLTMEDANSINDIPIKLEDGNSVIKLAPELFTNTQGPIRVSKVAYRNPPRSVSRYDGRKRVKIGSKVMSVSVEYIDQNRTEKAAISKTGAIVLSLHTQVDKDRREEERLCTFWDFKKRKWLQTGCHMVKKNGSHTTCSCNHLTNFAVLVLYANVDQKLSLGTKHVLLTLTIVGCSVSIACLAMTVFVYIYLKVLHKEKIMIHANLSVALLLAQLVFVASNDAHEHKIICKVVAIMLHFFFMAAFTWMMVEGIALYLCCTKGVFNQRDMRMKYFLLGWGLPAIIVAVSSAAEFPHYGNGPSHSCWLSVQNGLIWAFLGPMLVIVLINIFVLGLVIRVFLTLKANTQKTEVARFRGSLRAMVTLLPLLGLTWILSLLVPLHVVFRYFFVIGNTLQGMMIFFLHCICNEEVRKMFAAKRRRWSSSSRTSTESDVSFIGRRKHQSFDGIQASEQKTQERKYAWV